MFGYVTTLQGYPLELSVSNLGSQTLAKYRCIILYYGANESKAQSFGIISYGQMTTIVIVKGLSRRHQFYHTFEFVREWSASR